MEETIFGHSSISKRAIYAHYGVYSTSPKSERSFPQGEVEMERQGLFASLSRGQSNPRPRVFIGLFLLKQKAKLCGFFERGMGQLAHFVSPVALRVTALDRIPLISRRERDGTTRSLRFASCPPGYGCAVILDRAVFASLSRGQSNPLRGFSSSHYFTWNKKRSLTASLFVSKEREGFEPSVLWQTPDFETGPFDHSGISPRFA